MPQAGQGARGSQVPPPRPAGANTPQAGGQRPGRQRGRRASRYDQLNAYGPRWVDMLEGMVKGAVVSRFGHVALNELGGLSPDAEGPVVWLPTWDNRATMGGPEQSSLRTFAEAVMQM